MIGNPCKDCKAFKRCENIPAIDGIECELEYLDSKHFKREISRFFPRTDKGLLNLRKFIMNYLGRKALKFSLYNRLMVTECSRFKTYCAQPESRDIRFNFDNL